MSHTVRNKHKIIARTNKIQGQINGLKKMLEDHQECSDILQQIAAIKGAVNGLMKEVIKEHLTEHIIDEKDEKKREEDLQIILKILDSYIK